MQCRKLFTRIIFISVKKERLRLDSKQKYLCVQHDMMEVLHDQRMSLSSQIPVLSIIRVGTDVCELKIRISLSQQGSKLSSRS